VKILFFVDTLGGTRHFPGVVQELADRGHSVVLATARQDERSKRGAYDHPRIDIVSCPTQRSDRWAETIDDVRRIGDGMRFCDPRYAESDKLVARADAQMPKQWRALVARRPSLKRRWRLIQRAAAMVEESTPCDPRFDAFIAHHAPAVILVTPLVDFGSYQTDYVKCANRRGIPALFLLYGWDNLTSKGVLRVMPDRVLVWNTPQTREAVEFQNVPVDHVVAAGAARFDPFFAMSCATPRAEFCRELGFDPDRPIILYMCSSGLMAPGEPEFVWRWVKALRTMPDGSWLRRAQVLVRPHPAYRHHWEDAESRDSDTRVWTGKLKMNADQGLFDTLVHSAAVVALNTSGMIEAAIIGRPVFTIALPEFAACQGGTVHFSHVLGENGGIVQFSESFEEHLRQLDAAPSMAAQTETRSRDFLASFVRPRGLDVPAGRVVIEEIERAASMGKRPQRPPLWSYAVRALLRIITSNRRRPSLVGPIPNS
jgi:hypothetical protein